MANSKLEAQFITAILENKITVNDAVKLGLSERHFTIFADTFDFIRTYYKQNGKNPSIELVQAKNPIFKPTSTEDNLIEMAKAIRENKEIDIFYTELQRTITLLHETGSLRRAKEYLENKLDLFIDDEHDVFELTSPDFIDGQIDYAKRRKAFLEHGVYGIPTGFGTEFDNHLNGGWCDGNLYGIAGNTGVSKSWMAMTTGKAGVYHGKRLLYLALEGTKSKEYYRWLTITTEAFNTKLQSGSMEDDEFNWIQRQMREAANASGGKFFLGLFGNRDEYTPNIMRDKIEQYEPDIVIADYLTLMSDGSGKDNWEAYLKISKKMKNYASRYDIPVIAVLQGNIRSMMSEKMTNDDIASSKGVARDFDWIGGISKVTGKQNIIRVNNMKMRDNESEFDAFYQTGWNTGKVKFLEYAGQADGNF